MNGFSFFWGYPPKVPEKAKAVPKPKASPTATKPSVDSSAETDALPAFVRSSRPVAAKAKRAKE